jgi:hypothetical protein
MVRDDAVIHLLAGKNTLRDSVLVGVSISETLGTATVALQFEAREGSDFSEVTLRFKEVVNFAFRYDEESIFLNIWDLKFLKLQDGSFYITLDPDPATLPAAGVVDMDASETDNFFVTARNIEAEVTPIGG